MSGFDRPLQDLASNAREYVDLQVDDLKLRVTKGLSLSLGQVLALVLALVSLSILLLGTGPGCRLRDPAGKLAGQFCRSRLHCGRFLCRGHLDFVPAQEQTLRERVRETLYQSIF